MSTMTPRGTMGMEDNIQKIIGDTITELFDMLGKGEARRKQTIDCLLFFILRYRPGCYAKDKVYCELGTKLCCDFLQPVKNPAQNAAKAGLTNFLIDWYRNSPALKTAVPQLSGRCSWGKAFGNLQKLSGHDPVVEGVALFSGNGSWNNHGVPRFDFMADDFIFGINNYVCWKLWKPARESKDRCCPDPLWNPAVYSTKQTFCACLLFC